MKGKISIISLNHHYTVGLCSRGPDNAQIQVPVSMAGRVPLGGEERGMSGEAGRVGGGGGERECGRGREGGRGEGQGRLVRAAGEAGLGGRQLSYSGGGREWRLLHRLGDAAARA